MDQTQLYMRMKEIIGCQEVTNEVLQEYLSTGWWTREMLPWEHCAMKFQRIYGTMRRKCLGHDIYLCRYQDKPYYFGIGIEEPIVTDDMLENGTWLVYTWAD